MIKIDSGWLQMKTTADCDYSAETDKEYKEIDLNGTIQLHEPENNTYPGSVYIEAPETVNEKPQDNAEQPGSNHKIW